MMGSTGRQYALILLATVLAASVSLGGWEWWSSREPSSPAPGQVVQFTPTIQAQSAVQIEEKPTFPTIKAGPLPVKNAAEPSADEIHVKAPPTGKKHSKQDELLVLLAQRLHADAHKKFISRPGMGMRRMEPTLQIVPREWKIPEWTSEEITKEQPPQQGLKDLSLIHRLNLNQFSASNGPVTKGATPEKADHTKEQTWEIHSLDLVGLVMHDTPKVYVSKRLPDMKNLNKAPIREMDVFEAEGLEELINGKDLYVRTKAETVRVLGPIRASQACLKCHADAKDGEMLGAFSYTLRVAREDINQGRFQQGIQGRFQGQPGPGSTIEP